MADMNLYIDDSGQLHKKYQKGNIFVYGGFWSMNSDIDSIERYFSVLKNQIFRTRKEVKASSMSNSIKSQIIKRLLNKHSDKIHPNFVCVKLSELNIDFDEKKSVQLHKNYLIRRLLEKAIIEKRQLYPCDNVDKINVFIDNQSQTNINNYDSLERYIPKHLHHEYSSDIGLTSECEIAVEFKDSKATLSIQIADILANSKMNYHRGEYDNFKKIMVERDVNEPLKLPVFWSGKC